MLSVKHIFPRNALRVSLLSTFCVALSPLAAWAAAAATTTTLAITSGTATVTSVASGTAVTLTATVKAGSALVKAGSVEFCDAAAAHCTDVHLLGEAQLTTAGTATLKFIPGPGAHSYKAEFAGTAPDAASSSTVSALAVNSAPSTTEIAQSGSAGDYTLKVTVMGKGSATGPTGKVSFVDTSNANAVLGTGTLGSSTKGFTWSTPQSPATAAEPQSIVAADFNGDGIPDLAIGANGTVATKNIGSVELLLGNGNGTFQAAKSFTGLAGTNLIAADRFVTGGAEDILLVNNSSATTNNGLLFLGDGKGGLGTATSLSLGIDTITAMVVGDFNRDGMEDFIVAGEAFGVPAFNVFLGNGNGKFNNGTLNATSDVPITSLVAGDFTGQGALDLAVVHSDGTVDIFLQDGVGDFYPNAGTMAGSSPTSAAVGDFNGDGKADLAITNSGTDNVSILLGDGTGNFTAKTSPVTGSSPKAIAVGDFNADGVADLAVANSGAESVTILLGKGDGTFTAEPALDAGNTPVALAVGRFDGENTADIAVVNEDPASTTSASTATIELAQITETATTSVSGIAPAAAGSHLVDASYAGDTVYHSSVSATTSITGSNKQAAAPVFSPAAGSYTAGQKITLTDATAGAVIYYTTNGVTPTTGSTKYTAPFVVSATETIEAIATASGYSASIVASAKYTIVSPAATPSFSPVAGTYTAAQSVKLASATTGAVIYYTTNGTTPTTSSTKYSAAIAVSASETIKAITVASGHANSAVASAAYVIETPAATPTFSPAAGTYTAAQSVKLASATAGATIYYTTNGATPTTSSTKYSAAIAVSASETIKAIAVATGHTNSAVASAAYVIETPAATPTFSPVAGTYTAAQSVKLASATAGATIHYTTNGATPTTSSTKYSAAIAVTASETIKAIAVAAGHANSAVASAAYSIVAPAAKPTFSVASGTYSSAQSVQIFDTTPGSTIYYTTNGATPTPASSVYKSAVSITETGYLQAIAIANGYTTSAVASSLYSIGADVTSTPVLSPAPGAYGTSQTVTITDATVGATITYSVGMGTTVNTYTYTGPFKVSSTEYIAYDAIAPGYTRSAALEGIYTIGAAPAPQFSPAAGSYTTAQAVNIYDITPGAKIYYTTDGTTPTTSSAIYTSPVVVAGNETLRALAAVSGLTNSTLTSSVYVIGKGTATPTFSLAPGSYTSAQKVTISDITPAATIYYTTSGATPTTTSTKYTGPISVAATEMLKAIAVATGDTNSAVATAAYTIGYPIETVVVTSSGTNTLTVPVGGSGAFSVATENQSGTSYPSITVKTSTGANPSLPVQVTLCQTNPSTGQCLAAPAATLTLAPFAAGATPTFSVFVTATAAIASSPSNEVVVLFTNPGGTVLGSATALIVTN